MVIKDISMEAMYTDIELIDRYQRGIANEDEKHEVQNRLLKDSNFRDLFDDMDKTGGGGSEEPDTYDSSEPQATPTDLDHVLQRLGQRVDGPKADDFPY